MAGCISATVLCAAHAALRPGGVLASSRKMMLLSAPMASSRLALVVSKRIEPCCG